MARTTQLRISDIRAIYHLATECRERGDDPAEWRVRLLAGLSGLVGADLGFAGELGGLMAGRPRDLGAAEWGREGGFDRAGGERARQLLADPASSPLLESYARRGWGRARRRGELVDDGTWRRSVEYNQVYRPAGVDHPLSCFLPVPGAEDEVAGAVLTRAAGRPDFTPREAAVVGEAFAAIGPLVGGPLARFADPSPSALPPRVRQVLRCLLEGDADKQVAKRLGVSAHTVNQYVQGIFAHFGVTSRAELLARWVRRGWGGGFAWADPDTE